jgi:hypothetical protein
MKRRRRTKRGTTLYRVRHKRRHRWVSVPGKNPSRGWYTVTTERKDKRGRIGYQVLSPSGSEARFVTGPNCWRRARDIADKLNRKHRGTNPRHRRRNPIYRPRRRRPWTLFSGSSAAESYGVARRADPTSYARPPRTSQVGERDTLDVRVKLKGERAAVASAAKKGWQPRNRMVYPSKEVHLSFVPKTTGGSALNPRHRRRSKNPACRMCGGQLVLLGSLGSLRHFRCRQCGAQFSRSKRRRASNPRHRRSRR